MLLLRLHKNDPNYIPSFKPEPRLAPAYRIYQAQTRTLAAGDTLTTSQRRELDSAAMAIGLDSEDIEEDVAALVKERDLDAKRAEYEAQLHTSEEEQKALTVRIAELKKQVTEAEQERSKAAKPQWQFRSYSELLLTHRAQYPHLYYRFEEVAPR